MSEQEPRPDSPEISPVVSSRPRTSSSSDASWYMVLGVAGQIGYMIAIPAVIFVMGGAWLDKYFGTKPLLTLIGIPVAFLISGISVYRMIRQVMEKK